MTDLGVAGRAIALSLAHGRPSSDAQQLERAGSAADVLGNPPASPLCPAGLTGDFPQTGAGALPVLRAARRIG